MPNMLRVHMTAEDLLRTRFASQPAPLVEIGLAVATLQGRDPVFGSWRRSATGPLFLDPITTGLAEGLELVQSAPVSLVSEELRRVSAARSPTPWLRLVAARD